MSKIWKQWPGAMGTEEKQWCVWTVPLLGEKTVA